jgi:uncharacterized membrane protein YhaH (DUF805 family)
MAAERFVPMLGFLFGLNARLGRLQFFLASIALAIVMTVICSFIAAYAFANIPSAMLRPEDLMTSWPAMAAAGFFMLATVTLQSMRVRDIGWDPVCVIPAWIALMIVDRVIATRFPALSVGHEHAGTVVGGLVNLGLMLALLFWPSADSDVAAGNSGNTPGRRYDPVKSSVATERLARVSQGAPRPTWT